MEEVVFIKYFCSNVFPEAKPLLVMLLFLLEIKAFQDEAGTSGCQVCEV